MAKAIDIHIELPDDASDESIQLVQHHAREGVVVMLQQRGDLTIREAAMELGLTYEGYLDLLAEMGLPATSDTTDPSVLEQFRLWLSQRTQPDP